LFLKFDFKIYFPVKFSNLFSWKISNLVIGFYFPSKISNLVLDFFFTGFYFYSQDFRIWFWIFSLQGFIFTLKIFEFVLGFCLYRVLFSFKDFEFGYWNLFSCKDFDFVFGFYFPVKISNLFWNLFWDLFFEFVFGFYFWNLFWDLFLEFIVGICFEICFSNLFLDFIFGICFEICFWNLFWNLFFCLHRILDFRIWFLGFVFTGIYFYSLDFRICGGYTLVLFLVYRFKKWGTNHLFLISILPTARSVYCLPDLPDLPDMPDIPDRSSLIGNINMLRFRFWFFNFTRFYFSVKISISL